MFVREHFVQPERIRDKEDPQNLCKEFWDFSDMLYKNAGQALLTEKVPSDRIICLERLLQSFDKVWKTVIKAANGTEIENDLFL